MRDLLRSLDARTAPALGMRDLLQLLDMRELRERSECAIYCNHSRRTNCESALDARSIAITRDARTAPALGMRDLLQSLETRELRERSECAICYTGDARTARALGMRDLL
jgi:hypothetical protein